MIQAISILILATAAMAQPPWPQYPIPTNCGPNAVDCLFGWDASPTSNVTYRLWCGTNEIRTKALRALLPVPYNQTFTASVVAVSTEQLESDPAILIASVHWSNWVTVTSKGLSLLTAERLEGPWMDTGKTQIIAAATEPHRFWKDAKNIQLGRRLVE